MALRSDRALLTAPSAERLRAIVAHAAVADTHNIDRQRYTIAPEAPRTARRHGLMTAGAAIAVGLVDLLALLLAALAGLCVAVRPSAVPMSRAILPTSTAPPRMPQVRRAGAIALALAPRVCLIAFTAVVERMLSVPDFEVHIEFARQLAETGAMLPHFDYHTMVIVVQALTPADWVAAAGIMTLGGVAGSAAVLAWWLRGALSSSASPCRPSRCWRSSTTWPTR